MVSCSSLRVPHEDGTSPRTSIAAPASSKVHDPARGPAPAAAHRPATLTRRPNRVPASSASRTWTTGAWSGRSGTRRASGKPPVPSLPGRPCGAPEASGPLPGLATGVGLPGLWVAPPRVLQAALEMRRREDREGKKRMVGLRDLRRATKTPVASFAS
jgi:hypothetical protein